MLTGEKLVLYRNIRSVNVVSAQPATKKTHIIEVQHSHTYMTECDGVPSTSWNQAERFCGWLQVFVETLDKCFENVCELDLIFHMDKVSWTPPLLPWLFCSQLSFMALWFRPLIWMLGPCMDNTHFFISQCPLKLGNTKMSQLKAEHGNTHIKKKSLNVLHYHEAIFLAYTYRGLY